MENTINRKYSVNNIIGNGKFGTVYMVINIRTKETLAMKTEDKKSLFKLLKREANILNHLSNNGVKKIPLIHWYGLHNNLTCLIMTYFCYDLNEYINTKKSSVEKIYIIFKKCINIIKSIHENDIIHRDIKPQNFMIKDGDIYIIDFGLAIVYIDEDKKHIEHKDENSIVGTPKYVSFFNHCGECQSRRDDLLSLGYMCLYLINGLLPWEDTTHIDNNDIPEISLQNPKNIMRKMLKEFNTLKTNCDEYLINYFDYCYSLNFDEQPNYDKLISFF